jgi:hypothetical protein
MLPEMDGDHPREDEDGVYGPGKNLGTVPRACRADCAALHVLLTAARNTGRAHEKATGLPNDALISYIQAAQARAGCPADG